ncbi:MAG: glycine cleavage T C-terminal barrel domain-containing protein [Pseudomonadota bacterium]
MQQKGPHQGAALSFQPRIRKGAFFEAAWRHGCRNFSVYNRTYISGAFSDPEDEYWRVRNDVAIWPVMGERQVEITGPDAAAFVQYLTPRDLGGCAVNQCKYALITAQDGGILSDPIILKLAEDHFWLSTSDCDLELWAKGVAVGAGMDVNIRDAEVSVIQVQGPKSPQLMANLFGDSILDLKYYWLTTADFRGSELKISRTGWSGEFGYEIYLQAAHLGDALFDALLEAGGEANAAPGSVNQIRRIEAGILSWGVDMTPAETPFDVGMDRLVSLDGGFDFIGRDALLEMRKRPPGRRMVGWIIDGPPLRSNEDVWPLSMDGEQVGQLTSLAFSPGLQKNIALGLVAAARGESGTMLEVETWDGRRSATVTETPFTPKRQAGDARALLKAASA